MNPYATIVAELQAAGVTGDALVRVLDAVEQVTNVTPNVRERSVTPAALRMRKHREKLKKELEQQASPVTQQVTNTEDLRDIDISKPSTFSEDSKKDISPKRNSYPSPFEELWELFPRKVGKDDALRVWKKIRGRIEHDALKAAISKHAALVAGKEKQYIPHPATWLNDGRWQDEDLQPPQPLALVSGCKQWVAYGTPAGDAWEARYKAEGKIPPRDGRNGWWQPSEWPPELQSSAA